ncbi:MAG: flagellar basal body-associated FliL family protein [bacterium]
MESAAELPDVSAGTAPASSSKLPLMIVILAGLLVGAGVGAFVAGPVIAKKLHPAPADAHGKAADAKDAKGKEGKETAKVLRVVDNLVLNPAGTDGSRYLMLTAAFEVKDAAADELLKARDAEVRDVIIGRLALKSVEELTDMTKREALKAEVLAMLAPLFPPGTMKHVFFPQFVIQ